MKELILAIAAPIIAGLVAYLIARRTSSGKIANSEAADLWQESQAMRKELRDEVKELRGIISELRGRVAELESASLLDREKIADLLAKVRLLEGRIKELESRLS